MKTKALTLAMVLMTVTVMVIVGCQHNSPGSQPAPGMTNSNNIGNPGASIGTNSTANPAATNP